MKIAGVFFLAAALSSVGCSYDSEVQWSKISSHATQRWNLSGEGAVFSATAQSGRCATQLPSASLSSGYCFNEVPLAEINVSLSSGKLVTACVATHLQGGASDAALLVVDSQGRYVAEAFGQAAFQVVASIAGPGQFKVYAGFPTAAAGQSVKVLLAASQQFAIANVACALK